jgi:predicted Zn-ribbon and HTH transcriptional regulator
MRNKNPARCPHCKSIDYRKVGARGALEEALQWLLRPFRCGLCGHHFYLLPWQFAGNR